MRSSERISRSPGEWHDHQQAERERTLRDLLAELRRARAAGEPWIVWMDDRVEGRHLHELRDGEGRPVACPVSGCDAVAGSRPRRPARAAARAGSTGGQSVQLALGGEHVEETALSP